MAVGGVLVRAETVLKYSKLYGCSECGECGGQSELDRDFPTQSSVKFSRRHPRVLGEGVHMTMGVPGPFLSHHYRIGRLYWGAPPTDRGDPKPSRGEKGLNPSVLAGAEGGVLRLRDGRRMDENSDDLRSCPAVKFGVSG